jgi:hypothetical protein
MSSVPPVANPTRTEVGAESVLLLASLLVATFFVGAWIYVCRRSPLFQSGKVRAIPRAVWKNPPTAHVLSGSDDSSDEDLTDRRGSVRDRDDRNVDERSESDGGHAPGFVSASGTSDM